MNGAENMVPVCTKMPRALLEQARKAARRNGGSFAGLLRECVREHLGVDGNAGRYELTAVDSGVRGDGVRWLFTVLRRAGRVVAQEEWENKGECWEWVNVLEGKPDDGVQERVFRGDDGHPAFDGLLELLWEGVTLTVQR